MRKIGIFTSARSEYGSFRELIRRIDERDCLELCLIVSGNHLVEEDGMTVKEIEDDGYQVSAMIPMFDGEKGRPAYGKALARELAGLVEVLSEQRPDILLVNGDRGELLPLVTGALVLGIPVAHIAGGEITEGAIDDSVRHAVSKLSHLHFPTNELHAKRLLQMGEEPWRVTVTGEPGLDVIKSIEMMSRKALSDSLGLELEDPIILVTYHPETLGEEGTAEIDSLLKAMGKVDSTYVVTYPNADPGSEGILSRLEAFCDSNPHAVLVPSLGQVRYFSLMNIAAVVLGNSSSGLWEAPSFELPTVNVGGRQDGRLRAINVIDVSGGSECIEEALKRALSTEFKDGLKGMKNPYGDGHAIDQIMKVLETVPLDASLTRKKFIDCV